MDKIIMKNMCFHAYHGVYAFEQLEGQKFHIDVEMFLDLRKPGISDKLEDTVDYSRVYSTVKSITQDNKYQLVEKLANVICSELLFQYTQLEQVKVCVRKPDAPIDGEFDWVGVEVTRNRNDA